EPGVGGAGGLRAADGRGGPVAAQRDGRVDRDRASVRRDGRADHDDAGERAQAPRRPLRFDDGVRGGRDGIRDGFGERGVSAATETVETGSALGVDVQNGIAIATLDVPDGSVNVLDAQVVGEFAAFFDRVDRDAAIRAVVLISGKAENFIAGADIEQFNALHTAQGGEELSRRGQALMSRLEHLRVPVVAAIHGACLGGGLEAAIACSYRIVTDHPKSVLAAPDVQLGIFPGAGGTQRLPRLIGLRAALDLMLTGRNVRARKALQLGLVDEMVHPSILREIAVDRARQLADGTLARSRGRASRGVAGVLLEDNPLGRRLIFSRARAGALAKTMGNYPAPIAAIDAVRAGYELGRDRGYAEEARLFGEMAVSEVSRQLVYLFFATTALKKDSGTAVPAAPLPVRKLGILGAGFMGAGIASVAAMQGVIVRLKDAEYGRVA